MGFRERRGPRASLAPTTVFAAQPVDSANFFGSVNYDFDKVEQESYTGRVEHDVNRNLTLRNQARYNRTHREAVITTIQNPAAFVPETQTVTVARQGNERENTIPVEPDQPRGALRDGRAASRRQRGYRDRHRGAIRADACVGLRDARIPSASTTRTRSIRSSDMTRSAPRVQPRQDEHGGCVRVRHHRARDRWQLSGGLRWEHYDATFKAADAAGAITSDLADR